MLGSPHTLRAPMRGSVSDRFSIPMLASWKASPTFMELMTRDWAAPEGVTPWGYFMQPCGGRAGRGRPSLRGEAKQLSLQARAESSTCSRRGIIGSQWHVSSIGPHRSPGGLRSGWVVACYGC